MELRRTEQGFALYKEKDCIGECTLSPAPKGAQLAALCILPRWRRKGYGSYLLKEVLRSFGGYDREAATVFTAPLPVHFPGTADSPIAGSFFRCDRLPASGLPLPVRVAYLFRCGGWIAQVQPPTLLPARHSLCSAYTASI